MSLLSQSLDMDTLYKLGAPGSAALRPQGARPPESAALNSQGEQFFGLQRAQPLTPNESSSSAPRERGLQEARRGRGGGDA